MTRGLHYGVRRQSKLGLDGNEDVGMCQLSLENLVIYLGSLVTRRVRVIEFGNTVYLCYLEIVS